MVMGEHGPEPTHGYGGKIDAQLREIPFNIRANEGLAPLSAPFQASGQQGTGKTSPQPAFIQRRQVRRISKQLIKRQPVQLMKRDPTGKCLRGMTQQLDRKST